VIVVVRGEVSTTNPSGAFRIEAGDSLVLVGSHADINNAFSYLESTGGENA
jgi:Trk K+ transport system NAD-binding subunit